MTVSLTHAKMAGHVPMQWMDIPVTVLLVMRVMTVKLVCMISSVREAYISQHDVIL